MEPLAEGSRTALAFSRHIDELCEIMKFRLTYEGELMARGGGASHKHEIRRVFHRQLKRWWDIHPYLSDWQKEGSQKHFANVHTNDPAKQKLSHVEHLANSYRRGEYRFVPLATEQWQLVVSLDILFLRSGRPGDAVRSADLDGRLKTLIDALRLPQQLGELGEYQTPQDGEDPFFCLLEDDKLVGNVSVTTDTLLEPTPRSHGYHDTHDARVIIEVTLKGWAGFSWGTPFL